jgi:hypothetical protein
MHSVFRSLLVLAAAGSLFGSVSYGPTSGSTARLTGSVKTSLSPVCLVTSHHCVTGISVSVKPAVGRLSANRPKQLAARRPLLSPDSAACLLTPRATTTYTRQALALLAATNAQADGVRQTTEQDGESYVDFDSQLNFLFEAYNLQAQQAYDSYLTPLHGCPALAPSPVLFQNFIP